ncbi:blast:Probable ATP-dependent RNA helicase ddx20 [Drosophila guanche]|uniref:ATP-dependent RNA helicase n=1 Tax=Drosophila guanche TaxID=7266 RepID=A0A3B0KAH4_DROGU|nr:blast:Probable ATP-dependent RNA helicase ddx20 [Drosophila guanche]
MQAAAIPMALTGMVKYLLVQLKSGTGKTLIYVVTALQAVNVNWNYPGILVILPTRELAIQVHDTFRYLGQRMRELKVNSFIGGTDSYRSAIFSVRTIVDTDLIARCVDSHHANLVINLDPPNDHVTYLHRSGRSGRFESKAIAITFISSPKQSENFKRILAKADTGMSVLQLPTEGPPSKGFNYFAFDAYEFPYYLNSEANEQDEN